ncbi:MAG: glutathione S-transferase family protein [Pseudomonadota bacterium]
MYKIYQTRIAPNARRLRIFLAEKGVSDVEYITVNILKGDNLSEEFRAKNPFGRIPVLEFEDGSTLSESVAISRYFEEIQPEPPLFGVGARERAEIEMWNRRVELGFMMPSAIGFRNISGTFKDREYCDPVYGKEIGKAGLKGLKLLDQRLEDAPFIAGERYSIADATLTAGFDFLLATETVIPADILETSPGLKRWHETMKTRPSYAA